MVEPVTFVVWLIVLPLAWAVAAFVTGERIGAWLGVVGSAIQTFLVVWMVATWDVAVPVIHRVGGWGAPLGIDLAVDGLALAMLLLTQVVSLPLTIYARSYFSEDASKSRHFWPLAGFLIAGLNALFVSADVFNIYVTLEIVGLSAVSLVAIGGGRAQISAALRYLFATLIGSGAYLLGVALIYGAFGSVSLATLIPLVGSNPPQAFALAGLLMLLGLMLKTALFPLHYWLPPAHGGAAAPVSALLSALVVKASFYLTLRLWTGLFAAIAGDIAWIPALLGAGAILWGSWRAIQATRIKMLIAYSTVAQLGYLFLVFPLLPGQDAIRATVMQACAHGAAKAAMFAAAGVLIKATGQDTMAGLAGMTGRLPLTLFAFGLAGMTLMGLPPSSGFLAKWQLIEAGMARDLWIIPVVALAGGLLTAVYIFRILSFAFLLSPSSVEIATVPRVQEWTAFALAAGSVLLGLRGVELMALLPDQVP
jgi:formate hydrogenlyase subunit 3/multisubunit Na+/H+ antiporter MnhD subunit